MIPSYQLQAHSTVTWWLRCTVHHFDRRYQEENTLTMSLATHGATPVYPPPFLLPSIATPSSAADGSGSNADYIILGV